MQGLGRLSEVGVCCYTAAVMHKLQASHPFPAKHNADRLTSMPQTYTPCIGLADSCTVVACMPLVKHGGGKEAGR
jgi:hypothetical protein